MSHPSKRRTFVLTASRVYVPGSLPPEEPVSHKSRGGCCGSAAVATQESSCCGTSSSRTSAPQKPSMSCCS